MADKKEQTLEDSFAMLDKMVEQLERPDISLEESFQVYKKGMELLKTGKYSITEISEACGFSSATYFGTVFKKHFGKAPSDIFDK